MLRLFPGGLLPVQADLRVALAVRNARHREIHADLRALALEVRAQVREDVLADALCNADDMLSRPAHFLVLLLELRSRRLADRAELGSRVALINVTTYRTYKLCHF